MMNARTANASMNTTGTGTTPAILPPPNTLKATGSFVMGTPLQMIYTMPRAMLCMPSVTMKGAMLVREMMKPFTTPKPVPIAMPRRMDSGMGMPSVMKLAETMLEMASTDPTERSIPPPVMTIVIPSATMAVMELCSKMLRRFFCERKFGAFIAKKVTRIKSPNRMPDLFCMALTPLRALNCLICLPSNSGPPHIAE